MGYTYKMGITSSKHNNNSETLNWDKINTESMSSTVPNLTNISKDAQKLIANLDIIKNIELENTESDHDNLFSWIQNIGNTETKESKNNSEKTFSDTSPFISSDMYNYLMNNNSATSG